MQDNFNSNKYSKETGNYIINFYDLGFIPVINIITRPSTKKSKNNGTCIDHIFVKTVWSANKINSFNCNNTISDHNIVAINIDSDTENKSNINFLGNINYSKLINIVRKENWNNV